eukprot:GEMP01005943.1.p1 GENE.GEMP01005943.1~~GEMP01005943.1.p1  ORF type:complete len:1118 (+),score=284.36 GEMP01005943.1:77-3430(+)
MQSTRRRRERIRVVVRIRPFVKEEDPTTNIWKLPGNNTVEHNIGEESWQQVGRREELQAFSFDRVFNESASTKEVYGAIVNREWNEDAVAKEAIASCGEITQSSMIHNLLDGVHGCIMAYGPTSSGKTYSIFGAHNMPGVHLHAPGILPLVLDDLFVAIEQTRCQNGETEKEYLVRCSYLEIYNETISDLFAKVKASDNEKKGERKDPSPSDRRSNFTRSSSGPIAAELHVKEHRSKGFFIDGLRETIVTTPNEVLDMIKKAEKRKRVSNTRWNEKSSRAHVLFTVIVESTKESKMASEGVNKGDRLEAISGKLHIVDLAGSERLQKHEPLHRQQKISEEGRNINKSLFFLSEVISKLAGSETDRPHIPYRDSKLTRILASSLGGNALTSLLICLSPSVELAPQSLAALRFGQKAKTVTNTIIPQEISCEKSVILKQKEIIANLKARLEMLEIHKAINSLPSPEADPYATPRNASSRNRLKADLESQIHEASRHILRSGSKRRGSPTSSLRNRHSSRHAAPCNLNSSSPTASASSSVAVFVPIATDTTPASPPPDFAALAEQLHDDFGHMRAVVHHSQCTLQSVMYSSQSERTYWAGLLATQCVNAAVEHALRARAWERQRVSDIETRICLRRREQSWDEERHLRAQEVRTLEHERDEERCFREQQEAAHETERQRLQGYLAEEMTAREEEVRVLEEYCSEQMGELEEKYVLLEQYWMEQVEAQQVQHAAREDDWKADAEQLHAVQEEEMLQWKADTAQRADVHENLAREWQSECALMEEAQEKRAEQWELDCAMADEAHSEHARQWAADTLQLCEMHQAEVERLAAEQVRSTEMHRVRMVEREEAWQAELSAQTADAQTHLLAELGAARDDSFYNTRAQNARFEHALRELERTHKSNLRIAEDKYRDKNADLRADLNVAGRLHEARVAYLEELNAKAKSGYEADLHHLADAHAQATDEEKIEATRKIRERIHEYDEEWQKRVANEKKEWRASLEATRRHMKEEKQKVNALEERCTAWQTEYATLRHEIEALTRKRKDAEYRVTYLESTLALERQIKRSTEDEAVQNHMLDQVKSIRNPYFSPNPRTQRSPARQPPARDAYTSHMETYLRTLSKEGY